MRCGCKRTLLQSSPGQILAHGPPTGTYRCDYNPSSYTNRRCVQVETRLRIALLFCAHVIATLKLLLQRCSLVSKCRVLSDVLGERMPLLCEALGVRLKTSVSVVDFLAFVCDDGLEAAKGVPVTVGGELKGNNCSLRLSARGNILQKFFLLPFAACNETQQQHTGT